MDLLSSTKRLAAMLEAPCTLLSLVFCAVIILLVKESFVLNCCRKLLFLYHSLFLLYCMR
jgi:hypothetical protein